MSRAKCARCRQELYAHEGWRCPTCLEEIMTGKSRPGMGRVALETVVDFAVLSIAVAVALTVL